MPALAASHQAVTITGPMVAMASCALPSVSRTQPEAFQPCHAEETEARRGEATCSSQRVSRRQSWSLNPVLSGLRLVLCAPCPTVSQDEGLRPLRPTSSGDRSTDASTYSHLLPAVQGAQRATQGSLPSLEPRPQQPRSSPVFLASRSLEARALPSLQEGQARPPCSCPHPEAWTGLDMAHKAPPAKQGHRVGGEGSWARLGIWGLGHRAGPDVALLLGKGSLRREGGRTCKK